MDCKKVEKIWCIIKMINCEIRLKQDGAIQLLEDEKILFSGSIKEFKQKESKESVNVFKKIMSDIQKELEENDENEMS